MLTPDSYYQLARAVYGEMLLGGITAVGEFHYLHHAPGGRRYDNPNAMGEALIAAARDAGLRIALLDTCYVAGGIDQPLNEVQQRFSDGDAAGWAARVLDLSAGDDVVIGAAAHSVRGVPQDQLSAVASALPNAPLHIHLSEQVAENDACLQAYGRTPSQVLDEAGFLSGRTSAVHATHLTPVDVGLLGSSETYSCFCPTTERDLADGIGPSVALREAGSPLTLGSDSHAVVDLFEEMRAVELDERLASQERGHWSAPELLAAGTVVGHRSLGFADAGRIEVGARADLVAVRLDSVRTCRYRRFGGDGRFRCQCSGCDRCSGLRQPSGRLGTACETGCRGRAGRVDRSGDLTSLLLTGIGSLVTNDPAYGSVDGAALGEIRDAAIVIEGSRFAWVGVPSGRAGGGRFGGCRWPRGDPRVRGLALAPGVRGRPGPGVRRPDDRYAVQRGRHPYDGGRDP